MMQFGDFTFPIRPTKIQVELSRVLKKALPDGEMVSSASVQNLGAAPRVTIGEGVFVGETAAETFSALAETMSSPARLVVPGVGQWQTYLSELTYQGGPGTDSVGYAFRFVEAMP